MLQSVVMSYSHQRIAFLFESLLSVLQCVAVSCVFQYVAVCCSV